jgi:hypothetical protein
MIQDLVWPVDVRWSRWSNDDAAVGLACVYSKCHHSQLWGILQSSMESNRYRQTGQATAKKEKYVDRNTSAQLSFSGRGYNVDIIMIPLR